MVSIFMSLVTMNFDRYLTLSNPIFKGKNAFLYMGITILNDMVCLDMERTKAKKQKFFEQN